MAVYFASDFHLGLQPQPADRQREKKIINWLDQIKEDTEQLFLLGDLFDYWYEYRHVVPKGYIRLLSKISEFTDAGIPVHVFTGNHDMWMFGYLSDELGVSLHNKPLETRIGNKSFLIGHGDGLGPGDHMYKLIKRIFSNRFNQWLFARLHPNTGIRIMKWLSRKSREKEQHVIEFKGHDREWLVQYAEETLAHKSYDYFIFGHRHLPLDIILSNGRSRYVNTGDWIHHDSYARFENGELKLLHYES